MKNLVLRKVEKDIYGRIEVREVKYQLKDIAKVEYGKMKDFYNEADIIGNEMEEDESCIIIYLLSMTDGQQDKATFGSGWQVTFESFT